MKAIVTETHPNNEHNYTIDNILLCSYIPVGTFDLQSVNRPYDTVIINPADNPLIKGNGNKTLDDAFAPNGYECRVLNFKALG